MQAAVREIEADRERKDRRGEQERPADHAPAAHVASQHPALGVPDAGRDHREEQPQIGELRPPCAFGGGEDDHRQHAEGGSRPEERPRALSVPDHRRDGRHDGDEPHHDRRVHGGHRAQRDGGEEREPDHHARRGDRERQQLLAARAPRACRPEHQHRQ